MNSIRNGKHSQPQIMGILNATPDSFSGDGTVDVEALVQRGLDMVSSGAAILDIGGESSRPDADPVDSATESARVLPVIRALKKRTDVRISIDTYHADTAEQAIQAGAEIVNDITGLQDPGMLRVVADYQTDVIIMHMAGNPKTMQINPTYQDVLAQIKEFFISRIDAAQACGIAPNRIILDPGIGFGKKLKHNVRIIRHLNRFRALGFPILIGPSRKSFLGDILGLPVDQRLEGTLAAVGAAMCHQVDIVRVHDVAAVHRFIRVFDELMYHEKD